MKIIVQGFILFFLLAAGAVFGQVKYEQESRIDVAEAPLPARQFVDSLAFDRRVRWYLETSDKGKSVEAKSRRNGKKYSVEFDLSGALQDVEVELPWKALPEPVRGEICQALKADFERYRIGKVQRQYTGKPAEVLNHLTQRDDGQRLTIKYEIMLRGRKEREAHQYQYTFSAEGKVEKRAIQVFRNTDNLEY